MGSVTISFTLDSKGDLDLLRWLSTLPRRGKSEAIRDALRANLGNAGITLADVYRLLLEVKSGMKAGVVIAGDGQQAISTEPADIAARLDRLGL
jgi:hypothetical protein